MLGSIWEIIKICFSTPAGIIGGILGIAYGALLLFLKNRKAYYEALTRQHTHVDIIWELCLRHAKYDSVTASPQDMNTFGIQVMYEKVTRTFELHCTPSAMETALNTLDENGIQVVEVLERCETPDMKPGGADNDTEESVSAASTTTEPVITKQDFMSYSEIALEAYYQGIRVEGYKMVWDFRRGLTTGNSMVVSSAIESFNIRNPDRAIPWGIITGYEGGTSRIRCIYRKDLERVLQALKDFDGRKQS